MPEPIAPNPAEATEPPQRVSRADHRQQTRAALLESARRLFGEHGYQGVSAEEIARTAGVTERTLFRYFPSKASLVLDPLLSLVPELLSAISERPLDEPPYVAISAALDDLHQADPRLRIRDTGPDWRQVDLPPEERERRLAEFVQPLTETLRRRYEADPADPRPEVWARAALAALTTALSNVARLQSASNVPVAVGPQIKVAFAALDGRL